MARSLSPVGAHLPGVRSPRSMSPYRDNTGFLRIIGRRFVQPCLIFCASFGVIEEQPWWRHTVVVVTSSPDYIAERHNSECPGLGETGTAIRTFGIAYQ